MTNEKVKEIIKEAEEIQKEKEELRKTNKEEAIAFFEKQYDCKWEENKNEIELKKGEKKVYILKPNYDFEVWGTQWFEMRMVEDLLSILHLFYITNGER